MPKLRSEPWASFATWLQDEHDVTRQTASNYISLVRRILRNVEALSCDTLADYVDSFPPHHRSPMRAAWRRFAAWSVQTRGIHVPVFPDVVPETIPDAVQAAVRVLRQDGITAAVLIRLTWNVETDPSLTSLMPTCTWLRPPEGSRYDMCPVSTAALTTLRKWAYLEETPRSDDPVLPRGPHDKRPMALATVRRILAGGTRNSHQPA